MGYWALRPRLRTRARVTAAMLLLLQLAAMLLGAAQGSSRTGAFRSLRAQPDNDVGKKNKGCKPSEVKHWLGTSQGIWASGHLAVNPMLGTPLHVLLISQASRQVLCARRPIKRQPGRGTDAGAPGIGRGPSIHARDLENGGRGVSGCLQS